ncbi:MAG: hypothetical protein O9327_11150 [Polaromonas sp.]|nr:hypothetical protein [Polaromonas sp.]
MHVTLQRLDDALLPGELLPELVVGIGQSLHFGLEAFVGFAKVFVSFHHGSCMMRTAREGDCKEKGNPGRRRSQQLVTNAPGEQRVMHCMELSLQRGSAHDPFFRGAQQLQSVCRSSEISHRTTPCFFRPALSNAHTTFAYLRPLLRMSKMLS